LWDMASLTTLHERALTLLFAELEAAAGEQSEAFLGTPGAITERENGSGVSYWVHRYSDAANRRHETYLGTVGNPEVTAKVAALRERIDVANATINRVRILARSGFATDDRKAFYTLASLHNHGLFRAGAMLIGSHAYGAILNALGVKAVAYSTEDVDIARREALALSEMPPFLEMLRETGIEFFEVPSLDRARPGTSFLEKGGARLRVDLLVPSKDDDYPTVPVPELKAYAKGLPHLGYLLGASQEIPVLSSHGVVLVRVPVPERYAIHKLIVSQLRTNTSGKSEKDLLQAATLFEALAERFPGAIEDAAASIPQSAGRHISRALRVLQKQFPQTDSSAWEVLASIPHDARG